MWLKKFWVTKPLLLLLLLFFLTQNFPFVGFPFFNRFKRYCFHSNFLQEQKEGKEKSYQISLERRKANFQKMWTILAKVKLSLIKLHTITKNLPLLIKAWLPQDNHKRLLKPLYNLYKHWFQHEASKLYGDVVKLRSEVIMSPTICNVGTSGLRRMSKGDMQVEKTSDEQITETNPFASGTNGTKTEKEVCRSDWH